ncbi:MAG: XisI protein [Hormoscilla sp. GUM202]|nr:XisI protein [Hormoscilla sp. GUM202]
MDKIDSYRQAIEQILTEHAELTSSKDSAVKAQLIFDRERHHYQLIYVGWQVPLSIFPERCF